MSGRPQQGSSADTLCGRPFGRQEPERCSHEMLQLLLARLADVRAAPLTRSAAAAYAGSFLARAAFVPPPLVVSAVQVCVTAAAMVATPNEPTASC
jgi:RNA polymerase I specific transcription initiation factor RRN3